MKNEIKQKKNNKQQGILPLFLVVLLDMIGIGIVIPLLAPLLLDPSSMLVPNNMSESTRTQILGLLIAIYPIVQFFGAPIVGGYSDRVGRKKALIYTVALTAASYFVFWAGIIFSNLPLLFISRAMNGFSGGNLAVAYSAIADVSDQKSKTKNFGTIGMAFGLGFIIGPFIGGKLADNTIISWFNASTPFLFAGIISIINVLAIHFLFQETIKEKINKPIDAFTGIRNIKKAIELKETRSLLIFYFLLIFGFTFFTQFSQVYFIKEFNMTEPQIGDLFAYIGFWVVITQGGINRIISDKFKPAKIMSVSTLLLGISMFLLLLPKEQNQLYFVIQFIAIFNGLTLPSYNTILSNLAGKESQGEILGISQSIQSIAFTIPPIIAGFLATINYSLPIIMSGLIIITAWLVFITMFKNQHRHLFHEV